MWTEEEREAGGYDVNRYDATIAFTDAQLGLLFDALERRGVLDETVVIVAADHGEHLGERDLYGHANSLYPQLLHVPLIVWEPGATPARIAEFVTLRSLAATILDLAGVQAESRIPGESLASLWREGRTPADPLIASVRQGLDVSDHAANAEGDVHGLTEDARHYIMNPDGSEELYDLASDPAGVRDLRARSGSTPILARMRESLSRFVPAAAAELTRRGLDDERRR
jgi:arylsulfatase A-like enzyme